jgi:alpha-amylase
MIQTFMAKGTGFIEDVVINHRASVNSNWLNFPAETYKGVTWQLTAADICSDDESAKNGYKPTGAKDTGMAWDGARDLDHTGENVQKNVMAYEDFLLNDLGYVGFRYDFVKGFAAKYVGLYNQTAQPQFSVGECWDGDKTVVTNWINGTKAGNVIQSAAFDFPMKYYINDAFGGSKWSRLTQAALATDPAYARYAVTFVDNHDTGRSTGEGGAPLYANIEAANAFILTLPGTPCVFLKHWLQNKKAIKKLIAVRKAAGITNESKIMGNGADGGGYWQHVQGTKGCVLLIVGNPTIPEIDLNYQTAITGTNYQVQASPETDISAVEAIDHETSTFVAPDFCTVADGEVCAFFEAPSDWTTVKCWAWDGSGNYTGGTWPGAACTRVGTTQKGVNVWKWTWNNTYTGARATMPANIIFNNNNNGKQTADLDFVNTGYYNQAGALQGTVSGSSGIEDLQYEESPFASSSQRAYDLLGRPVNANHHGVRIVGGKKRL